MTTVIVQGNSDGQRRCDAKCYDASGPDCDCVCGGQNHGHGLQAAMDHNRELVESWARARPDHPGFRDVAVQLGLEVGRG